MRDLVMMVALALAQDPAPQPAASNVHGSKFPAIDEERRVTFRLQAPDARRVEVKCRGTLWGGKAVPMSKGPDGVWAVTTEPAEPGFYYYDLVVDGVPINDPGSRTYPGWAREMSGLEVPDRSLDFYDVKPVPHGEVRQRTYFSKTTETTRLALVYTPPDYDRDAARRYPVLYLQHGSGENERSWTAQGRANYILDNLIAEGRAEEMIVVMEQGYATKAGAAAGARLVVKQIKSGIGHAETYKRTLVALGLRHQAEIVVTDNPSIRGMLFKVHHLVSVKPQGA